MRINLDEMSRTEIHHLIDEFIHNQRDREVLKRKLTDGITYERLSEEFDLSVGQAKNIVYRGKDKLFRCIERINNHGSDK